MLRNLIDDMLYTIRQELTDLWEDFKDTFRKEPRL